MNELPELRALPPIDLDRETADRIAARARGEIGRRQSPVRFIEPVAVAITSCGFLAWALLKIAEVFR